MPFTDLTGNTFSGAIGYLYCHNMVSGVSATSFNPGGSATRAQFARLVVKAFGLQITTPSDGQQLFTDVPPSYYAFPYIETGYIHAILSGYTQAQCQAANALYPCYLPNRAITRAELVKLIVKAGNYPHITPTIPTFVDVPSSYFAYTYIETAYAYHLVHGVDASHFAPAIAIRRDEMAEVVYKAITTP